MVSDDIDFVLRAKRQLRFANRLTVIAIAIAIASWIASIVLKDQHDLALAIAFGALLGAFLVSSDVPLSGSVIGRAELINALEAQLNRNAEALKQISQRRASHGA